MTGRAERVLAQLTLLSQDEQLEVLFRSVKTPLHRACEIDVTPFRERFLILNARDGVTAHSLAERIGWTYGDKPKGRNGPPGDGTRLKRRLGLAAENSGSGYFNVRRHISYETAVVLCDALDISYTDADV